MKTKLWCRLFGHDFIGKDAPTQEEQKEYGKYIIMRRPKDFCQECGLTKKEAGIE